MKLGTMLLDQQDVAKVRELKLYQLRGYVYYRTNGTSAPLTHFLLGRPPAGCVIDHINGDKLDNRRKNLRILERGNNVGVAKGTQQPKEINAHVGPTGTVKCEFCGRTFSFKISTRGGMPRRYCSDRCRSSQNNLNTLLRRKNRFK